MSVIYVRIVDWACDTCRAALLQDCRDAQLELPIGEFALIPDHWRERPCPHDRGFTIDVKGPTPVSDEGEYDDVEIDKGEIEDIERDDQPNRRKNRWRDLFPETIDATKGIGYPAREVGRYGSHPQHDGSEDD
jgi:hypothetical protein